MKFGERKTKEVRVFDKIDVRNLKCKKHLLILHQSSYRTQLINFVMNRGQTKFANSFEWSFDLRNR